MGKLHTYRKMYFIDAYLQFRQLLYLFSVKILTLSQEKVFIEIAPAYSVYFFFYFFLKN